jgi:hypothetical protein
VEARAFQANVCHYDHVSRKKIFVEGGIILFCLWHMSAIAMTLLPEGPGLYGRIQARGVAISNPYILSLSQWQKWSIFSPNPLTRASFFRIDLWNGEDWQPVVLLDYEHLPWYRREKELKILSNLESEWYGLSPYYLKVYCNSLRLASGSSLRLMTRFHILPEELSHLNHMAQLQLPTQEVLLGNTTCTGT